MDGSSGGGFHWMYFIQKIQVYKLWVYSVSQSGEQTSALIAKDKFQLCFLSTASSFSPYRFPNVLPSAPSSLLSGRAAQHSEKQGTNPFSTSNFLH